MYARSVHRIHDYIAEGLVVILRFTRKWGLARPHTTFCWSDLLFEAFAVHPSIKTDLLVVLDVFTVHRVCHLYAAQMHA